MRNRIAVPVEEFMAMPKKAAPTTDKWAEVYEALTTAKDNGEFELKLVENYDHIPNLPEKAITLYPILRDKTQIRGKLDYLLDTIISKGEGEALYKSLVNMLVGSHWIKYADEFLLDKVKDFDELDEGRARQVVDNVLPYLEEMKGQWEEENKVSLVLDFVYDCLSEEDHSRLARAYAEIYCDTTRMDKFPQKKFAEKIFRDYSKEDRWKVILPLVTDEIKQYKADEEIFSDSSRTDQKQVVIRWIQSKFRRIIEESEPRALERKLERMFEGA